MIDAKILAQLPVIDGFDNVDYELRITASKEEDPRIMTFIDVLWGFEVTGGYDQFEPLTILSVQRSGLARRAGIRVNDTITKINDTPAELLTLKEAQMLIRESGKHVKIYVRGDDDLSSDEEMTVDYWFTPPSKDYLDMLAWEARMRANRNPGKWNGLWPWNDRIKPMYKESNCYMVPSHTLERIEKKRLFNEVLEERRATLNAKKEEKRLAMKMEKMSSSTSSSSTTTVHKRSEQHQKRTERREARMSNSSTMMMSKQQQITTSSTSETTTETTSSSSIGITENIHKSR